MWRAILQILLVLPPLTAQLSDTTPPQLAAFSFYPSTIDTRSAPQTINFTATATDDLSGVSSVRVFLKSPSGRVGWYFYLAPLGGTATNATYALNYVFPQNTEPGPWQIASVTLRDRVGNSASVSTSVLNEQGFSTTLSVTSDFDLEGPQLSAFALEDGVVSTADAGASLRVRLRLIDQPAGVARTSTACPLEMFSIYSPTYKQRHFIFRDDFTLVSGTEEDGIWEGVLKLPRYAETGEWQRPMINLADKAGNCREYSTALDIGLAQLLPFAPVASKTLTISPGTEDTSAPQMISLSFEPAFIDTTLGPETVKMRVGLRDNLAGIDWRYYGYWVGAFFSSPSGQQFTGSTYSGVGSRIFQFANLLSGTGTDGIWETELRFPQYSEAGTWNLRLDNWDTAYNFRGYNDTQLKEAGFPSSLIVILPSGLVDGVIGGASTTTALDSVFGERASITAPPNVLPAGTSVSIDVLDTPPAVPIPTGFQASGSPFVTIHLIPAPAQPFPAPGLTIVLPLSAARIPGSSVHLFRVNPTTGLLEAAIGVDGRPVIGTANGPDGLSATFKGIARLSTIIGLVPNPIQAGLDVMPGSSKNPINTSGKGVIPVAVLGSPSLDVREINVARIWFGPGNATPTHELAVPSVYTDHLMDVNADGFIDLVLHFRENSTGLVTTSSSACIYAENYQGTPITGCDAMVVLK